MRIELRGERDWPGLRRLDDLDLTNGLKIDVRGIGRRLLPHGSRALRFDFCHHQSQHLLLSWSGFAGQV